MNRIKKGSACTPLGIVDKFGTYKIALKNTLLNKFAIETPNNKLQEVTLQTAFFLFVRMVECLLVLLLRPACALVLGNGCERLCVSRPLLGSYVHQESI